jgi:hypothetical protein
LFDEGDPAGSQLSNGRIDEILDSGLELHIINHELIGD